MDEFESGAKRSFVGGSAVHVKLRGSARTDKQCDIQGGKLRLTQ